MSDLSDKTLEMASNLVDAAINERVTQARVRQCDKPKFAHWDGESCFDCGDDLPEERIEMGRVRCVPCQTAAERKGID